MSQVQRTTVDSAGEESTQRHVVASRPRKAVVMMVDGQTCDNDDDGLRNVIRLEKASDEHVFDLSTQHVVHRGPFRGVVVRHPLNEGLPRVRKANIRMEFNVYVNSKSDDSVQRRRETRGLLFWFARKTPVDDQKQQAAQYFKLLLEPENFPADYVGYIKKAILLLWHFSQMKRVQLSLLLDPEPEPEVEESIPEEPPIENFITVITPAVYDYQYLPEVAVSKKSHVTFRVRAGADAHVALSTMYGETDRKTYELVLGGWNNSRSAVRYGGRGPVVAQVDTPGLLDAGNFQSFWISWDSDAIQVGTGSKVGREVILRWSIPKKKLHSINCMSVSTGPGSDGQWEFIEYLAPIALDNETTAAKRNKIRRAILWYAKKSKMLETLEDAFPASLKMADLLRRSLVSLTDMMEAVMFLRDLKARGLVMEVSRGVWLRSPVASTSNSKTPDVKLSKEFPNIAPRDTPTVALITSRFCEKVAVDAMLESKVTYIKHDPDGSTPGELTQSYTLGSIGGQRVVSMKLPLLYSNAEATSAHGDLVTNFLGKFSRMKHVLVVGTGGALPHFSDFDQHVRLGDIVVSAPRQSGRPLYIHCQEVYEDDDGDCSFGTRLWDAAADSAALTAVRKVIDIYAGGGSGRSGRQNVVEKRPWERVMDEAVQRLNEETASDKFYRPPAKTDRLFAVLERGTEPVYVMHPVPEPGSEHLYRENRPNIRCGTIASGRVVAHNALWRTEVSDGIVAYDRGLHAVVEAVHSSSKMYDYLIVLGTSDYVDGGKGRSWQPYASLAAAAFTRSIIDMINSLSKRPYYYR